ncbi:MAG TPA: ferrochelatase, partial [Solirubrobacteraceae bacterium]
MTTGVLLMTYGSPTDRADVGAYLTRVRGGRTPSAETVREFERRYALIGGSPLIPITRAQARGLEAALGPGFVCGAGMRFSEPSVAAAARELVARGAGRLLGLIVSPQYSPIIMGGYGRALEEAAGPLGVPAGVVEGWWDEPAFVRVMADRVVRGLERFPAGLRGAVPVLLTAHSLPKRVVDREPGFVVQLTASAGLIAAAAGLAPEQWRFAYQSAGHTPEEWLKPDILDLLPALAAAGHRRVLLAPVQFVGDHLETLYDIDVGGKEQAEAAGFVGFERAPAPNADPDLCRALAEVVR